MKTPLFLKLTAAAAGLLVLASCASTRNPIGFPFEEDLSEEMTGAWFNPEGIFHVHCDAEGNLRIAGLEWDEDSGDFVKSGADGPLLRLNDEYLIVNLREDDEDENYTFALMKVDDKKIVCWGPETNAFRELVKKKQLEGDTTDHGVTLTSDGEAIARKIDADSIAKFFTWGDPMIFWRSPDF